jgi:hypothetical protein
MAATGCVYCPNPSMQGIDRCERNQQIYLRGQREQEFRKTKGFFQTGFEFGAGFTLGSSLMLIPVAIIVGIAATV